MAINVPSDITTYGAIILPFDKDEVFKQSEIQNDPETIYEAEGVITSALENSEYKNEITDAIENAINDKTSVTQKIKDLVTYMNDNRDKISGLMTTIGSKFSGIAMAQAIMTGKITAREAADYLFMGFAPALGIQGSLMGYSGLNQMKDALFDGSINVGAFVSGFARTLKGGKDLADLLTRKETQTSPQVIEFDLTISHSESYQSETPDRRVQNGQSLNEYIHNMPETIQVQCALQEGKRYSKAEFRAILQYLRERKETVQLVLGDEIFDSLVLTEFTPSHDCTKGGMDYSLSFKKVIRSDIDTNTEVSIQKMPAQYIENDLNKSLSMGNSLATSNNVGNFKSISGVTNLPNTQLPKIENPEFMTVLPKGMSARQYGKLWGKGGYSVMYIQTYPQEAIEDYEKRFGDYYDN